MVYLTLKGHISCFKSTMWFTRNSFSSWLIFFFFNGNHKNIFTSGCLVWEVIHSKLWFFFFKILFFLFLFFLSYVNEVHSITLKYFFYAIHQSHTVTAHKYGFCLTAPFSKTTYSSMLGRIERKSQLGELNGEENLWIRKKYFSCLGM